MVAKKVSAPRKSKFFEECMQKNKTALIQMIKDHDLPKHYKSMKKFDMCKILNKHLNKKVVGGREPLAPVVIQPDSSSSSFAQPKSQPLPRARTFSAPLASSASPIVIDMHKNYYVLPSITRIIQSGVKIPGYIDEDSMNDTIKEKIEKFWNRGCYTKENLTAPLTKQSWVSMLPTIQSLSEKLNVLLLFYPVEFILNGKMSVIGPEKTVVTKPIILINPAPPTLAGGRKRKTLKNKRTYAGGGTPQERRFISSDFRRDVISVIVPELSGSTQFNKGRFILKIARDDGQTYSQAYEDEAMIYKHFNSKQTKCIVKYFGSGTLTPEKKTDNTYNIDIEGTSEKILLPNPADNRYHNKFFILLENTFDYVDYKDFIDALRVERIDLPFLLPKSIVNITNVLHRFNNNCGFFHGDLHSENVKLKSEENSDKIEVKLFDFDFSAFIGPNNPPISRNLGMYELKFASEDIFATEAQPSNTNPKLFMNGRNFEMIKPFAFAFDFFRLWFSVYDDLTRVEQMKLEDFMNGRPTLPPAPPAPSAHIIKHLGAFKDWYDKIFKPMTPRPANWNVFFHDNYFYDNIYNPYINTFQQQPPSEPADDLNSLTAQLERLKFIKENRTASDQSSFVSSFATSTDSDISQKSQNGGKKQAKKAQTKRKQTRN